MGVGPRRAIRRSPTQLRALADAAKRVTPLVLANERRLEVAPALCHVLPDGIQRGSTVGVGGVGAMSLALTVAAGPVSMGGWVATLGCEDLGLTAAEQSGVPLHRMVMVAQPPRASWGTVAATLVDAFDVVLLGSTHRVRANDARRLTSHLRERGGLLIDAGRCWPNAHDFTLEVVDPVWVGLGDGHGVLASRQVAIEVSGRRGARPHRVPLMLPGPHARPEAIDPTAESTEFTRDLPPLRQVG